MRLLDTAKLTLLNIPKRLLEINSVQMERVFLNLVFNISETRFEEYPVSRHDCTIMTYYKYLVASLGRIYVDIDDQMLFPLIHVCLPPNPQHFT